MQLLRFKLNLNGFISLQIVQLFIYYVVTGDLGNYSNLVSMSAEFKNRNRQNASAFVFRFAKSWVSFLQKFCCLQFQRMRVEATFLNKK